MVQSRASTRLRPMRTRLPILYPKNSRYRGRFRKDGSIASMASTSKRDLLDLCILGAKEKISPAKAQRRKALLGFLIFSLRLCAFAREAFVSLSHQLPAFELGRGARYLVLC